MYTIYKDNDGKLHKDSDIYVTDEPTHHADSVRAFIKHKVSEINKIVPVWKVISITDGSASQYKGKRAFRDIAMSELTTELGVPHERHFFETSHGKSMCDGIGGCAKCNVWRAILQKKAKINDAYDFFSYSKDNFEYSYEETDMHGEPTNTIITRKYVWIPRESIEKDREETRTVPGTRKLHMVRGLDPKTESIEVTNLSCFCPSCQGAGGVCPNAEYVDKVVKKSVKLPKKKSTTESEEENEELDEEPSEEPEEGNEPDEDDHGISVDSGSYVAVKFWDKKHNLIIYVGTVIFMEEHEVEVRFMKRVNGGKGLQYEWPDEEDRSWVDYDDIVCELQIPDPISRRNKWKFSELKTKDNNKISRILGKMAFQLK